MSRPKILLLNATLGIGGAENVTAALCRGVDRDKFDVVLAHLKWRGAIGDELAGEGFKVVSFESETPGKPDYLSSLRLRRFLAAQRVDLVHTNDLHAMIDAAICRMSVRNLRQVSTFHFGNYPHQSRRYHLAEKYLSRVPDRLVAVGQVQRQRLLDTYGFQEGHLDLIRNGVPDVGAQASELLRNKIQSDGKIVIGSVSTLIEQKGIADLLDVADRLRQRSYPFKLVIAGEGHLRPGLEAKAKALGLSEDVEFYGWVDNAPQRVLPWIDVFVQTSLWEAMSMVVLEAMSCGLPIVATTVGENPYVLRDGDNGFLATPKDVDRIADRLGQLIQSPELRRQLGQRARSDWEQYYTARRMCVEYEALYSDVLRAGRQPVQA
jgi:glycosyltransferase involved in cell wall biosynthesis